MSDVPERPPAISLGRPAVTIGFSDRHKTPIERPVATEAPVQVSFADVPFGVMMMTPADLDDFAYGFSLTEGVVGTAAEVRAVKVAPDGDGFALRIDLAPARLQAHLARRRVMTGRTGCGVCGIADAAALARATRAPEAAPDVRLDAIARALCGFEDHQPLNAATRAVHGAAWADDGGTIRLVREDVGRHNALDKLLGACLKAGVTPAAGFIVVTSRASYEMVEKAATFGARTLVAVSAPTGLAIARAQALDVTLVGIARRDGVTVFHGIERVIV